MGYLSIVFNNRVLPLVCWKQPIALAITWDVWEIPLANNAMRCSPFLALESSLAGKKCLVGAFIDLHAFVISIRKLLITLFQLFWNILLIIVDWSYTTTMEGQNYFLLPNRTLVPIRYPLSVTRISTLLSPYGRGSTLCFFETDVSVFVFRSLAYFTQHRQVHPCGYW